MAEEPTQHEKSRRAKATETVAATEDPVLLPVAQLVTDGPALLGYEPWTVAGALYGRDPEEELSADDAKSAVESWLQQPVEVDPRIGEEE